MQALFDKRKRLSYEDDKRKGLSYKKMSRRGFFLLLLLLSVACTPPSAAEVTVWRVAIPPMLRLWMADLESCLPLQTVLALDGPEAAVSLRWGEPIPLTSPAFAIGQEAPLVIVNPQSGVSHLSEAQARAIFQGQVQHWREVGGSDLPIEVWIYPPEAEGMPAFTSWLGGEVSSMARLAMTPQEMLTAVQSTPGAIGWVGERWKMPGTITVAQLPAQPILLIFSHPPSPAEARWVSCLQAQARPPSLQP